MFKTFMIIAGIITAIIIGKKKFYVNTDNDILKSVVFKFNSKDAETIHIAGDFNNWNISSHPLFELGNNVFNTTIYLKPGTYHYKFIVNGTDWVVDPNAECVDNENGEKHSVITV